MRVNNRKYTEKAIGNHEDIMRWTFIPYYWSVCAEKPWFTYGIQAQSTSNAELRWSLCCLPGYHLEQAVEWPVKWKSSTLMWRHHNAFKHPNMPHTQPMIYKHIERKQTRLKFCIYASGPTIMFKQNGLYVPWLQTLICDFQPQTFTEKTIRYRGILGCT